MAAMSAGQTLQPTALVHEAYLRLLDKHDERWRDERHFFLAAARAMHDILVEHARQRSTRKRGGERQKLDLDNLEIAEGAPSGELLALEEALGELERLDARKHQVVLLRFFAGCTTEQTARAWLHEKLSDRDVPGGNDADGT
jgi:RNA polymerase sigma factor (TIGR02999 family)